MVSPICLSCSVICLIAVVNASVSLQFLCYIPHTWLLLIQLCQVHSILKTIVPWTCLLVDGGTQELIAYRYCQEYKFMHLAASWCFTHHPTLTCNRQSLDTLINIKENLYEAFLAVSPFMTSHLAKFAGQSLTVWTGTYCIEGSWSASLFSLHAMPKRSQLNYGCVYSHFLFC